MTSSTFASNPAPKPDRLRDGDIWRSPGGWLYSVGTQQGLAPYLCLLRSCGDSSLPRLVSRTRIKGWTRTSWGGQP